MKFSIKQGRATCGRIYKRDAVTAGSCVTSESTRKGESEKAVTLRVRNDRILVDDTNTGEWRARTHTDDRTWPTMAQVQELQEQFLTAKQAQNYHQKGDVWLDDRGRVVIPTEAVDMQTRLMVVAHAGAAGHRGQQTTMQALTVRYVWPDMKQQVWQFVRACLLCLKT